jgi:hypothetical protein
VKGAPRILLQVRSSAAAAARYPQKALRDNRNAPPATMAPRPVTRGRRTQLQSTRPHDGTHARENGRRLSRRVLRYALLLRVEETNEAENELCLIDIKEAVRTAALHYEAVSMPRDNAHRVVQAARALSPALGERMRSARILDRSVFVRELRPKDLKIEIEALTDNEASGWVSTSPGSSAAHTLGRWTPTPAEAGTASSETTA